MKFPRAADDTCTYEYKLRCDCKTNGIEPKRNSEVTGVGFTNKITKKKVWIEITQTRQYTRHQKERDGETKEGTLSPCRKTAAASRDKANPDTSKMETLSVPPPLRPLLTPVETKERKPEKRGLNGSARTGPTKGPPKRFGCPNVLLKDPLKRPFHRKKRTPLR
jgi:hypothetical protein